MPTADHERRVVIGRLAAAGCVAAEAEASELLAARPDEATLESWLRRREVGEPLAWITGSLLFCGRRIRAVPGVYVPRPQTEELARRAATLLPAGGSALDLCTGVGAVAAHLAATTPSAVVIGVDVDVAAARCAASNGVMTVVADLAEPLHSGRGFDVITAVAPYVPTRSMALLPPDVQRYAPPRALDGGDDGLDLVRRVVDAAGRLLRPQGWLLIEVGGEQDLALAPDLQRNGFGVVNPWHDEDGDLRGIAARRGPTAL